MYHLISSSDIETNAETYRIGTLGGRTVYMHTISSVFHEISNQLRCGAACPGWALVLAAARPLPPVGWTAREQQHVSKQHAPSAAALLAPHQQQCPPAHCLAPVVPLLARCQHVGRYRCPLGGVCAQRGRPRLQHEQLSVYGRALTRGIGGHQVRNIVCAPNHDSDQILYTCPFAV